MREMATSGFFASRARSAVGTPSIARTSPASNAATRDGSVEIRRSVTLSQAVFVPQ